MNASMSRRSMIAGAAALPAAVLPTAGIAGLGTPAEKSLFYEASPAGALARAEHAIDCLKTRHVRKGWQADAAECERALNYFRRAADAGKWPDDAGVDEAFAIDFMHRHGQSTDWILLGDVSVMVCMLASLSNPAA